MTPGDNLLYLQITTLYNYQQRGINLAVCYFSIWENKRRWSDNQYEQNRGPKIINETIPLKKSMKTPTNIRRK